MKQFAILSLLTIICLPAYGSLQAFNRWVNLKPPSYRFEHRPHERTRPVIVGDIVYYATLHGVVYAIHRIQGNILWKKSIGAGVDGAFSYGRSKLFVGDVTGNLYALHARNGEIAWHKKVSAQWLTPPVQVGARLLVMNSAHELYALSERKGTELWQYSRQGDEKMTIRGTSTPVVFGAEVYQGFADGHMVALSLQSGKVRWIKKLRNRDRFYDVDATPFVDARKVITGTYDGSLYRLDRVSGEIQWRISVGVHGGVAVDGNKVYFSGLDKHFYAVDAVTGRVLWKTKHRRGVGMTPVLVGGGLLIPTSSDPIYLLNPSDGRVLWKGSLGVGTMAAATAHQDGWFYCLSNYGQLYAFQLQDRPRERRPFRTLPSPSSLHRYVVTLGSDSGTTQPSL